MPTMLCRAGAAACSSLLPTMAGAGPGGLPCGRGPVPLGRGAWQHSGSVEGTGNSLSALPPSCSHFCYDCARGWHQTRLEIKPLLGLGDSMAVGATVLRMWAPCWPLSSNSRTSGVPLRQRAACQPCCGSAEREGCGGEKRKSVWASRSAGTGTVPCR